MLFQQTEKLKKCHVIGSLTLLSCLMHSTSRGTFYRSFCHQAVGVHVERVIFT
jgi:hypothetical protein